MKGFWNRSSGAASKREPDPSGFFTGDVSQDRRNVEILLKIIAEVNSAASYQDTLKSIVDGAIELTGTERGLLFHFDEFKQLKVRVARDREGNDLPSDIQFSRGVPRRVVEQGTPVSSVVTSDEEAFELGTSVMELKLRKVMCVPLRLREEILGAVYVDSKAGSREFTELDIELFQSLAHQVAVTMEKVRTQEMQAQLQLAQEIQKYLLAPTSAAIAGLDVHWVSRPCEETNGDYLGIFTLGPDRLGVAVGDVTGHGVGPALLVARTQAFLEALIAPDRSPGDLLSRINNALESHTRDENFVTLFFSAIDAANRRLAYSSAGHPPALLFRSGSGEVEELPKTGLALGIQRDFAYRERSGIQVDVGDVLVVYSDGLTEAMDPERRQFGIASLRETVAGAAGGSAREISERIDARIREFTGGASPPDDRSWVVVRVTS